MGPQIARQTLAPKRNVTNKNRMLFCQHKMRHRARCRRCPLEQSFRVAGTVVDALNEQPLARAQVFLLLQSVRDSELATVSTDDGRFSFEGLVPGKYALTARRTGYLPQFYKQHEQFSTAIIVGPDLNTENLRFALRPEASISGQILDEMNEPVRNAQVLLFRQGLNFGTRGTWQEGGTATDDRGQFRFAHLAPGTCFVAVSARPWYAQPVTHQRMTTGDSSGTITEVLITNGEPELDVLYPVTFFPNAVDFSGAAPITLHAGDAETADIMLHPVPALHMTIHTAPPGELGGIWAEVSQPLFAGAQNQVPVNNQQIAPGVLEISGLPPGRLNVRLGTSKDGQTAYRSQSVQLAGDMDINAADSQVVASPTPVPGESKVDCAERCDESCRGPAAVRDAAQVGAGGVVVTGGTSIMEGVPELAEGIFDQPVRRGVPIGVGGMADVIQSPIYATGAGLAIYGSRSRAPGESSGATGGTPVGRLARLVTGFLGDIF